VLAIGPFARVDAMGKKVDDGSPPCNSGGWESVSQSKKKMIHREAGNKRNKEDGKTGRVHISVALTEHIALTKWGGED